MKRETEEWSKIGEPTKEDADRALQSARKMYEWLKEVLDRQRQGEKS